MDDFNLNGIIEKLEKGILSDTACELLEYSEKLSESNDEISKKAADQLALCALLIEKKLIKSSIDGSCDDGFSKIDDDDIRDKENFIIELLDELIEYFKDFEEIRYFGPKTRSRLMSRRLKFNHFHEVNCLKNKLTEFYSLEKEEWIQFIENFRKNLGYYEGWQPITEKDSKDALVHASIDTCYVKAGCYLKYVRLINRRDEINNAIDNIKENFSALQGLIDKYENYSVDWECHRSKLRIIEKIKKIKLELDLNNGLDGLIERVFKGNVESSL